MKELDRQRRKDALAVIWFLRQESWWQIARATWRLKTMSQSAFVQRLQNIGMTPKGTKT